jgi:uncharacterized protein (DUF362 family)
MNRREFIKDTLTAGAAAILVTGGIILLGSRNEASGQKPSAKNQKAGKPKDYRVTIDPAKPVLVSAKGKDYRKAVAETLLLLGGMEAFVTKGDVVCIKPNIGWDRTAEQGANTHPLIIAELVKLCIKAGAKKVMVTDVPCNSPDRTYNRSGIRAAAEAEGASVIFPENGQLVEMDFGSDSLGKWPILKPILEADKLINVPVVKHHSLPGGMTAAMKNWFGALSGPRGRLHQDIDNNLVELASLFRPTLTVVDATRVLQRNGPQGGQLSDLITYDTVVASTDQIAAEAYVTRFMNKKPADFPYVKLAQDRGLGIMAPPDDKIVAIDI